MWVEIVSVIFELLAADELVGRFKVVLTVFTVALNNHAQTGYSAPLVLAGARFLCHKIAVNQGVTGFFRPRLAIFAAPGETCG
ncbi:hypothetical protein V0R50_10265 [Pseudomonas sp. 148P]|uniref:Uncharacterized protein n=1 Tax=Pseudomonas ulcerans TaxID=3115852 RepID=A0ABU7HQ06_9PSED|nr:MULTISPECIES: hypothetical protein [unclassified Pseudomonas]MEE1922628.1 hypothetical protein [Pseudomonas sp. 147P]MEE1933605.1 hypothetical protein [Pseudomonas sp. 148P]